MSTGTDGSTLKEQAQTILNFPETTIDWWYYGSGDYNPSGDIKHNCSKCEHSGGRCGFSTHRNQTFCVNDGMISNWVNHDITTWYNHTL
jgi:hypothetical protein